MSFTDFEDAVGDVLSDVVDSLTTILVNPRNIGGFVANVTIEEQAVDKLRITKHPVEQGAAITDHSFKEPAQVTIRAGWSNSSPQAEQDPLYIQGIYASFLALQASRQPFDILTGKRSYTNMLVQTLTEVTDKEHENAMVLVVECAEINIVATQTVSVPSSQNMQNPEVNGATQNSGTQSLISNPPNYNAAAAPGGSSISAIPGS